jgi:hypothetical protein
VWFWFPSVYARASLYILGACAWGGFDSFPAANIQRGLMPGDSAFDIPALMLDFLAYHY